jgi:hypothetical protein
MAKSTDLNEGVEMGQAAQAMAAVVDGCYGNVVAHAFEAADRSADPVQGGIEAAIAMAEANPAGARRVLWRLQGDTRAWDMMEAILGGEEPQVTLRIGAALHRARAELASPTPQLQDLLPELLELLGRRELSVVD